MTTKYSKANTNISNIVQLDGADSSLDSSNVNTSSRNNNSYVNTSDDLVSDNESSDTECDTEDEIEADTTPINITPPSIPSKKQQKILKASSLPLVAVLNARSLYIRRIISNFS